jgi:hypothetical protein
MTVSNLHIGNFLDVGFYFLVFEPLPTDRAVAALDALLACENATAESAEIAEDSGLFAHFFSSLILSRITLNSCIKTKNCIPHKKTKTNDRSSMLMPISPFLLSSFYCQNR